MKGTVLSPKPAGVFGATILATMVIAGTLLLPRMPPAAVQDLRELEPKDRAFVERWLRADPEDQERLLRGMGRSDQERILRALGGPKVRRLLDALKDLPPSQQMPPSRMPPSSSPPP
jgi:hypothetical protein